MSEQAIKEKLKETITPLENAAMPSDVKNGTGEPIENHPLAKVFGIFKDNPIMDVAMENIRENRRRMDQEMDLGGHTQEDQAAE